MFTLQSNRGQSVVEYLIFFAVIAVITLLSVCTLYPSVHQACEDGFQEAVEEFAK